MIFEVFFLQMHKAPGNHPLLPEKKFLTPLHFCLQKLSNHLYQRVYQKNIVICTIMNSANKIIIF